MVKDPFKLLKNYYLFFFFFQSCPSHSDILCYCPGFNVTTDACCGLGKYNGWIMCASEEMACSNASNHIWWDQFHPTDAVNAILADNVWNGLHTNMCYPMNMEDVIA